MVESTETQTDDLLVRQAMRGNFSAFESLVSAYERPLWQFIYGFLGSYDDANDVVQQTLIQVYRSLTTLENPARFRAWLFAIARHKCLDHVRRSGPIAFSALPHTREDDTDADTRAEALLADPTPLPDELIERRETQHLLREAIATLSDKQRTVVTLRYTTDLSFNEIGAVLGLNENTIKTLFQRAKTQLRFYVRQHS